MGEGERRIVGQRGASLTLSQRICEVVWVSGWDASVSDLL